MADKKDDKKKKKKKVEAAKPYLGTGLLGQAARKVSRRNQILNDLMNDKPNVNLEEISGSLKKKKTKDED